MRALALAAALLMPSLAGAQALVVHQVKPSAADPGVKAFDEPSLSIARRDTPPDAPLALVMTGTGGVPRNLATLMEVVADQGYRALGLEYDDTPAVVQVCPRDPDPACSAKFRERRLTGGGPGVAGIDNPVAEGIVPRLVAALKALAAAAPAEGWGGYLDGDQPRWDRIVVSGLSQGAGMAAFIAKQHMVRRVVLFSSPWEFTGADRHPAPWLSLPSATPPDRWFAEYNARENTVPLIKAAYAKLAIAPANIRVFDLDLPAGMRPGANNPNPYHGITIRDPRYAPQWRAMFGRADDPVN